MIGILAGHSVNNAFNRIAYFIPATNRLPSLEQGCLSADGPLIVADVAEIVTMDAEVVYERCVLEALNSSGSLFRDVTVGGRARLVLVSPLFPGSIEPVSQEVQDIDSPGDIGTWAWQVRADKPGDHNLSLVLSILGPEGDNVEVQNRRAEVVFQAQNSFSYYAGVAWRGTTEFITSLTGLVTAAVAAIAAMIALRHQIGKRSYKSTER